MARKQVEVIDAPRLLFEAQLRPWQGSRFRPTEFPDVGAAELPMPDGTTNLLVESVQSLANRLEKSIWDSGLKRPITALSDMPYVRYQHPELGHLTSLTEAHRLASPYLFPLLQPELLRDLGPRPQGEWDQPTLARAILRRDPNSLLHGVFLVQLKPVARLTRLLSGFIEARNVMVAPSGGVKLDNANPSGPAEEGKGHIPFRFDEYISDHITAYFNFDLQRLRSYGLSEPAQRMLLELGLLKVRRFLSLGLRLRSACDLEALELKVTHPADFAIPSESELLERLQTSLSQLRESGELGDILEL